METLKDEVELEIENIDKLVKNPQKNHFVRFSLPVLDLNPIH